MNAYRTLLAVGLMMVPLAAQDQPAPAPADDQAAQQQVLAPEQLESMVAPIALYPDSLLSQVLVASTYPLELAEAGQWLQQNSSLTGTALVDAAKQQSWDPSVQALVPFADVIKRLTSDIRWTTDLGNAFLAQQADVMSAVQRLRAKAKDSGKLTDTEQQKVVVDTENGQSAIEIQPTNPQVVYVPVYDPGYFWAPYPLYPWPPLFYGGVGFGWHWGLGVNLGFYFGGCCGWGGWGWGPGWFNHTIIVNNNFYHRYGFQEFHGGGAFRGNSNWVHNPEHRGGVPYRGAAAARFQGAANTSRVAQRPSPSSFNRGNAPSNIARPNEPRANNHSAFGGVSSGGAARQQSDHGASSLGSRSAPRSAPAPRAAPAPRPGGGGGGGRGRGR